MTHAVDVDRLETLAALGDYLVAQADWLRAGEVFRELVAGCLDRSGPNHPSSLAAQGDLAVVLFELGEVAEANRIEQEAFDSAKSCLGKTHPVTSVLAWNMVLRHEHSGEWASARKIVADDLSWLLTQEQAIHDDDQKVIQDLLARRLRWDSAATC